MSPLVPTHATRRVTVAYPDGPTRHLYIALPDERAREFARAYLNATGDLDAEIVEVTDAW